MQKIAVLYALVLSVLFAAAQNGPLHKKTAGFEVFAGGNTTSLVVDSADYPLVQKSVVFLQGDIEAVCGRAPAILHAMPSAAPNIIIIGTIERSSLLRQLVAEKKLDVSELRQKWEAYKITVVNNPEKGIKHALVIAGSDRRGLAYGIFELSRRMGVSPWHWWADVLVPRKQSFYVDAEKPIIDSPAVKYRGIFINDEAPAFSGWAKEKYGGINHKVYEKVFELLLRLKANYLWPAMWGNAFNDDDPLNPVLADEYGIVMGTSHHEPMLRAQQEWKRYGKGQWNYDSNAAVLQSFWKKGMENMGTHESIVTIGMRGDGDMPMTKGSNIELLEKIVKDQRSIIESVTGKPASATPQLWALYKEVQDYYDKGMRVPDDVTLLLCDDNWGNIRRLPALNAPARTGGYGIYYHFDYVGGPRNYKWLNTNNIARVWEQMHLAWEYNVRNIWIVNVGDIKPMEFPISFFLDYAWKPGRWNEDNLPAYFTGWAAEQFGAAHAVEIGQIIQKYAQYNTRRKPELLSPDTYSLGHYDEAERVVGDYNKLLAKAEQINRLLPAAARDAFFELVLHPVKACANLNALYLAVARNHWYAAQNDVRANRFAQEAKQLYLNDSLISLQFNRMIAGGKWNHMMDQTHIGYTYWQQPPANKIPELKYVDSSVARKTVDITAIHPPKKAIAPPLGPGRKESRYFFERDGYLSVEAAHFNRAVNASGLQWKVIPGIGRTASGICTFPVTGSLQQPKEGSPHTEYVFYVKDSGQLNISAFFSPTLNLHHEENGLQYAISVDDEKPQILSINKDDDKVKTWEKWVAENIIISTSLHTVTRPGRHVLKYWIVSPAVVLQKMVIDCGGLQHSYLGPPETLNK